MDEAIQKKVIVDTSVHLMRVFIVFAKQIIYNLKYIDEKHGTPFLPVSILKRAHYLFKALFLLPDEIFTDFFLILSNFVSCLTEKMNHPSKESILYTFYGNLVDCFISFLIEHAMDVKHVDFLYKFIVKYLSKSFNSLNIDEYLLNQYVELVKLPKFNVGMWILPLIADALNFVVVKDLDGDPLFDKVEESTFKLIRQIFPFDESEESYQHIIYTLILYFEWLLTKVPEIEVPEYKQTKITYIENHLDYKFIEGSFFDKDLINMSKPIELQVLEVTSYKFEIPERINNLITLFKLISTSKSKETISFVTHFIHNLNTIDQKKKAIKMIYYSGILLTCLEPSVMAEAMEKTNGWAMFFTPVFFTSPILSKLVIRLAITGFIESESHLEKMFLNISALILSLNPKMVEFLMDLCMFFYRANKNDFIRSAGKSIFDSLIIVNYSYLNALINGFNDDILPKARSTILVFFKDILEHNELNYDQILFGDEVRMRYILSLLFEKDSQPYAYNFMAFSILNSVSCTFFNESDSLIKQITPFIHESNYQDLFFSILHIVTQSSLDHQICQILTDLPFLDTLTNIPNNIEDPTPTLINEILKFIYQYGSKDERIQKLYPKLFNNIQTAFSPSCIDQKTVNLVFSIAMNQNFDFSSAKTPHFNNSFAFQLLINTAIKSNFYQEIFTYLINLVKNCLYNRYKCFEANIIPMLIPLIPSPEALELIKIVGTTFIKISDVSTIIRKMYESQSQELAQAVIDMISKKQTIMPSFFHFSKPADSFSLRISKLKTPFTISMMINLEEDMFDKNQINALFSLSSDDGQIFKFNIGKTTALLQVNDFAEDFDMSLPTNEWMKFTIMQVNEKIIIQINDVIAQKLNVPTPFRTKATMIFQMIRVFANIEDITFYSDKNIIGEYQAQYHTGSKVLNSLGFLEDAQFNGLSVKSSVSILDIIPTCGGPKIFLPLFTSVKSPDYLSQLIDLIKLLSLERESYFESQPFFRCFAINLYYNCSEIMNEVHFHQLIELSIQLQSKNLLSEINKFIWSNLSFWKSFSGQQIRYVTGMLSGYLTLMKREQFVFFDGLLAKFIIIFLDSQFDKKIITDIFKIYHQTSIIPKINKSLLIVLGLTLMWEKEDLSMEALGLFDEIISINQNVHSIIEKFDYFTPFVCVFNSTNEKQQQLAANIIFQLCLNPDLEKKCRSKIYDAINIYNFHNYSESSLLKIFSYIYSFKEHFPTTKLHIAYPVFIPLFAHLLYNTDNYVGQKYIDYFRESINDYSAVIMTHCKNWLLWFFYISTLDKSDKFNQWVFDISLVLVKLLTKMPNMTHLSYCLSLIIMKYIGRDSMDLLFEFLCQNAPEYPPFFEILTRHLIFSNNIEVNTSFQMCSIFDFIKNLFSLENKRLVFTPLDKDPEKHKNLINILIKHIIATKGYHRMSFVPGVTLFKLLCVILPQPKTNIRILSEALLSYKSDEYQSDLSILYYLATTNDDLYSICLFPNAKKELMLEEGKKLFNQTKEMIINHTNLFSEEMNHWYYQSFEKLKVQLSNIMNSDIMNSVKVLENDFHNSIQLLKITSEVQHRQNKKFWENIVKTMNRQNGGPWSLGSSAHFKINKQLDGIGRRLLMKPNHHFLDHLDASRNRDLLEVNTNKVSLHRTVSEEYIDMVKLQRKNFSFQIDCKIITITGLYEGKAFISSNNIWFEASKRSIDAFNDKLMETEKFIDIKTFHIQYVLNRRYLHVDIGTEIFTIGRSYFFIFRNNSMRNLFLSELCKVTNPSYQNIISSSRELKKMVDFKMKKWTSGEISNYEYIYWLNILSGRSFNDLSQYPIFPWILNDYESERLDYNDLSVYRDLSKQIGQMNDKHYNHIIETYHAYKDEDILQRCVYRFHYSTPAYVIGFLVRCEPFTSLHIQLQGGKFDHADRQFKSVGGIYEQILSMRNPDYRELIPEFFTFSEFLLNSENFDFGQTFNKENVDDVILPKWAENSASQFIAMNRIALESDFVSEHLNDWIDLMFGYKQRGPEAEKCYNLFHAFSYYETYLHEKDPVIRRTIQTHASNFGVVPEQLFTQHHPQRDYKLPSINLHKCFYYKGYIEFEPLISSETQINQVFCSLTNIIVLSTNGRVDTYSFDGILKQTTHLELNIPSMLDNPEILISHSIYDPMTNLFGLTTQWSSSFKTYELKSRALVERKAQVYPITSICSDDCLAVTGSIDSSIVVWNLRTKDDYIYVNSHSCEIAGVALSRQMKLIASYDVEHNLAFSISTTGTFIRSAVIKGNFRAIHLSNSGFVVLIFQSQKSNISYTKIKVCDLSGRIVRKIKLTGKYCTSCICDLEGAKSYIAIALDTKVMLVYNIYDLRELSSGTFTSNARKIVFNKIESNLLVLFDDNTLMKSKINF